MSYLLRTLCHDFTIDLSQISNDLLNFPEGHIDFTSKNSTTEAES